jgi:hypothetical protein
MVATAARKKLIVIHIPEFVLSAHLLSIVVYNRMATTPNTIARKIHLKDRIVLDLIK